MVYRMRTALTGVVAMAFVVAACGGAPPTEEPVDPIDPSEPIGSIAPPPAVVRPEPTTTLPPIVPTTMTPPSTVPPVVSPAGFTHPGILVDREQLDLIRAKVTAGAQPWSSAYTRMATSGSTSATPLRPKVHRFSSLDYVPKAVTSVQCFAGTGRAYAAAHPELGYQEIGCREQTDDAVAAYTHALMWTATGNRAHAAKAIEIMNAWSATLKDIKFDQPRTDLNQVIYANGKLQAGWTAQVITRAAEIIRYSNAGWASTDIQRFSKMLNDVFLPLTITGFTGQANWLTTLAEATINIGVFNDDRATFDTGIATWRARVPTTIYMPSDGAVPVIPTVSGQYNTADKMNAYWYRPSKYVAGMHQETGRDLSHMTMGMGGMSNAAATAEIQGIDLFGAEQVRIVTAYELNAGFVNQYLDEVARRGGAEPAAGWRPVGWLWPDFATSGLAYRHGWEVAYRHYAERGVAMPNTARLVERLRPSGLALHMSWETLTHGG